MEKSQVLEDYQNAITYGVYKIHSNNGYLRLSGNDRLDFIQRQSTNDIKLLNENIFLTTVLTSTVGRILDVLQLIIDGDGSYGMITLPGIGNTTFEFLQRKIFFNDSVILESLDAEISQIDLEGPEIGKSLSAILESNTIPELGSVSKYFIEDIPINLIIQEGLTSKLGYRMIFPSNNTEKVINALKGVGLNSISQESLKILRIENSKPHPGSELNPKYTPLETNLEWAVSQTKGCYTGQEVIARQINYDKVSRQLVQLQHDKTVNDGSKVQVNGKNIGNVTSTANSPRWGNISLAILRKPHHQVGSEVDIIEENSRIAAKVVEINQ